MRKIENQNVLLLLFQIIRYNLLESVSLEITSQSLVNSKIDELERSLKHFSLEKSTLFFEKIADKKQAQERPQKKNLRE